MEGCSYSFPVDHAEVEEVDREWECPHPAHEGTEYCIFHLPVEEKEERGLDAETVIRFLERRIEERGRRAKEFLGACFRELDLSHYVFNAQDNYPVDLSYVTVHGDVDMSHSDFAQPVVLENASIDGRFRAANTAFNSYVRFNGTEVRQYADLSDTVFSAPAHFRDMTFSGRGTNDAYPNFVASFSRATIQNRAEFHGTRFHGRVDFRNSTIRDLQLHENVLDVLFFGGSDIESVEITSSRALENTAYISFARADIGSGVFTQPYYIEEGEAKYPDESVFYNLKETALGQVRLGPDQEGEVAGYFRFLQTEFDGFDFSSHEQHFGPKWELHSYDGPLLPEDNVHGELREETSHSPEEMEETYVRARKAAKRAEHVKAASEFFRHQIRHRKYRYLEKMQDSTESITSRLGAFGRYIAHHLNGLVSGHFERPWRVVGSSIVLTFVCAALYPAIGGIQSGSEVIQYSSVEGVSGVMSVFQQSLYFSVITATTLGYGDMTPVGMWAKQLAGWEARIGSILMALFIFVLGRRVS